MGKMLEERAATDDGGEDAKGALGAVVEGGIVGAEGVGFAGDGP